MARSVLYTLAFDFSTKLSKNQKISHIFIFILCNFLIFAGKYTTACKLSTYRYELYIVLQAGDFL